VVARADSGDEGAALALGVYVHRLRAGIGAMAVAAGGVDALVFTGGVGENSERVRDAAVDGLAFLGSPRVLVVEAREDIEVARQVREVLAA
jgi:acetate kinase